MGLIIKGNTPTFNGDIVVEVPTPTYSGTASSDPNDSINPYTMQGPGAGGAGQTESEIEIDRSGTPPSIDPDFDSVTLLLQANGSVGETAFTDSGPKGKIITNHNNVAITDTDSIFGGKSFQFNGIDQSLTIPQDDDFFFDAGADYTIECWLKPTGGRHVMSSGDYVGTAGMIFYYDVAGFGAQHIKPNSTASRFWTISATLQNNVWFHYAISKQGNAYKLFYGGIQVGSVTYTGSVPPVANTFFYIGSAESADINNNGQPNPDFRMQGFMDQIRITKGVARYTENFTPPTGPF